MPETKYIVIKTEDLQSAFNWRADKHAFERIIAMIGYIRNQQDKKDNHYLVLTIDEPYAAEVYAIMHKHGHTPCADCHKCVSGSCPTYYKECPWFSLWSSGIAKAEGKPCGG